MNRKRKTRRLRTESLEQRVCMAASLGWDGPGLGSATLTYTVGSTFGVIDQSAAEEAIDSALNAWSDIADVNFVKTSQTGLPDSIDFSFRSIDGAGGALAQAYFPDDVNPNRIAGDVQFDTSENWEVGNASGNAAYDLLLVAVHEIGHALGLEHDDSIGSVMNDSVSAQQSFSAINAADADAALALYAPVEGSAVASTDDVDEVPEIEAPEDTLSTSRSGRFGRWSTWRHSLPTRRVVDTPTDDSSATDDASTDDSEEIDTRMTMRRWINWRRLVYAPQRR